MRKLVLVVAVGVVAGCATAPSKPASQTVDQLVARCAFGELLGDDGKPIAFMTRVTCPLPAGTGQQTATWAAARFTVPLAVMVGREWIFYLADKQQAAGAWSVIFYLSPGGEDSMIPLLKKEPGVKWFRAAEALQPQELAFLRLRGEIIKEDRTYAECKSFIMDVAAASTDVARGESCERLMAVIDRAREARQRQANHAEMVAAQRDAVDAMETANRLRVVDSISRSLQGFRAPVNVAPVSRSAYTNCATFGNRTNCVTQ